MASLARRIAPAAVLGGVAVAVVGLLDPALAKTAPQAAAPVDLGNRAPVQQPGQTQQDQAQQGQTQQDATKQDPGAGTSAQDACAEVEWTQGPASMTPWGPVQVAAAVVDGRICGVQALVYPMGDSRSQRINAYAIPTLDSMASQVGVAFDGVSGATYTTEAYRDSLQQLLDSLG